ncbi:uncharacterized protein A4U43_C07F33790 [Asparagus officinalis]|uniref:Uncharacterized protein n=1 Tax=Asparagus officinalis TaxID=4686 RepID=A0A5P1EKJ6_ASPOF|nr:uncharacterized protein A4U43_C07F33790 [Asparagus officinalis]
MRRTLLLVPDIWCMKHMENISMKRGRSLKSDGSHQPSIGFFHIKEEDCEINKVFSGQGFKDVNIWANPRKGPSEDIFRSCNRGPITFGAHNRKIALLISDPKQKQSCQRPERESDDGLAKATAAGGGGRSAAALLFLAAALTPSDEKARSLSRARTRRLSGSMGSRSASPSHRGIPSSPIRFSSLLAISACLCPLMALRFRSSARKLMSCRCSRSMLPSRPLMDLEVIRKILNGTLRGDLLIGHSSAFISCFAKKQRCMPIWCNNSSPTNDAEVTGDSYMVAFAGRKYAARSLPAFVGNSSYSVTSFTLVLEFQKGTLQNLNWKRDGCSSCSGNSNFVCLNNQDCAIKTSSCKGQGQDGTVDCSIGIQTAFSGTDKHNVALNSWYEVSNLRQYSLFGLYSNLRDSLTSQFDSSFL